MKLDNKTILVTGANRGIGAALVRALLKHNVARVYAAARRPSSLPAFGDARVVPLALDITDEKQVAAAAFVAQDAQIVINNAGTANFGTVTGNSIGLVKADMQTNYFGTLSVTRAFAPVLERNGRGVIANVISVVGLTAFPSVGGYSASKAALHSATQSARNDLAGKGIHVVGIYPGPIDTDMARDFPMEKTTPEVAAGNILAGLIAEQDYIFPDPMSKEIGGIWVSDPLALERQYAGRPAPVSVEA
jgi:NAD(P)-dependent dehydrogenase (short-subunit alcohol dehydrogenase family)